MSPSLRRLMKEAAELSTSPSPHFHAAPVSDSNLYDWHFTIAGPPSPSPYASGIYHGRIVLPPTYPLRPPSFRFLTPSGRFEVNREICLSISGHHEETWQPAWGIRTSLTAIRSFMDGDAKGQVGGLDVGEEVRREYAGRSRDWCCEVCGRSNGVIFDEWKGYCRERGVEVGEMGDERIVSGARDVDGAEGGEGVDCEVSGGTENTGDAVVSTGVLSETVPEPEGVVRTVPPPVPTLVTTAAPVSGSDARPMAAVAPREHVASQQSEDLWLDRVIVGVLIALVFMILRRMAYSEE